MRAHRIGTTGRTTRVVITLQVGSSPRRARTGRRAGSALLELAGAGVVGGAVVFIAATLAQWVVGDRFAEGDPAVGRPTAPEAPHPAVDPRAPHAARLAPVLSVVADSEA